MHTVGDSPDGLLVHAGVGGPTPTKRAHHDTLLPLTPGQTEVLSSIKHGESAFVTFQLPLPQHISPSIDLIQYAWRAVASHNSALRARLDQTSGEWMLRISRDIATIEFEGVNSGTTDQERPATLLVLLSKTGLSAWIRVHRALIDDYSLPLICDDFLGFLDGVAPERRADLGAVIKRTLARDAGAAKLYWRTQSLDLASPPIHGIPIEPVALTDSTQCQLSADDTNQIIGFAASCGQSVQCVLYAAWAATLAGHTETTTNSVTFAVTGRDLHGDDDFVGPGDQIYPLVVRTDGELTIKDVVAEISGADATAAKHAFIGYNAILQQFVGPEGPTLVTVRTSNDNTMLDHIHQYPNLFALVIEVDISTAISIQVRHGRNVTEKTVNTIVDHFFSAIRSIALGAQRVADISLISQDEKDYLLDLGKPLTEPAEGLVHELFEEQAKRTPNSPAVQFENDTPLSYDQLNRYANAVARQLPSKPGTYVPVCVRRSTNLILALCAVLKSGAAYVTTDPDVPKQRNNFIYEDVSAEVAIVDRSTQGTFPKELLIEDLLENVGSYDSTNLGVKVQPSDVVYVIYTSGSTGNPKGVLLEHRAAYSGLAAFPYIEDLRQLLFHNPVFSAAQRSVWSTLKQGGCLCLASKENLTVYIGKTINEMDINTIDVTPATAGFITPGSVPCLKRMTVAGELINPALVPQWVKELELLNAYGLSENTQFNWRHVIQEGQNPQNIGRPVDTTTAYVLKPETTELTPLLIPGELCLGGHQLARGYLNRPDKTQEVFIPNPFGPGRLYRTGDLVLTHADGSIEMIGRIDFSVKINDQRVDPGESNSIIQMHPKVYDSCVVAASIGNRMALVAAVVHSEPNESAKTVEEVRSQLEKQLPRYMIPSYWTSHQELPLNINGKVDIPVLRRMCEELDQAGSLRPSKKNMESAGSSASPQEEVVRGIFADALSLSVEEIPLSATFTELGGTSLEAIKIASVAAEKGVNLTVAQVLIDGTVAELASSLDPSEQAMAPSKEELAPKPDQFDSVLQDLGLDKARVESIIPATPLQEGIIAESMMGVSNYMLFRFYQLRGVTIQTLRNALQKVVEARPLLRTVMAIHGSSFVQVVLNQLEVPFHEFDGGPADYNREWLATTKMVEPGEPLIRLVALRDGVVALETHHALVDTWSYHFIQDDVRAALSNEELKHRPPFSNYVQYISTKPRELAQQFWKDYLHDAVPTQLRTGNESSFTTDISLNPEVSTKKRDQLATILYTSWAVTLMSWTSTDEAVFLVNISGREAPIADILHIQGPTLATVPMRIRANGEMTAEQLTRSVTSEFWKLAEHAHIGLRNIWKTAGIDSDTANTGVNFLVSLEEPSEDSELPALPFEYPNVRDLVTIEMDSKTPHRARLYSSRSLADSDNILSALKQTIEAILHDPSITLNELRSRIIDQNSSDASSSHTDPIFDVQDTVASESGAPRAESVSTTQSELAEANFDDWKAYMEGCLPSMLEPNPLGYATAELSVPRVKVSAAASKAQATEEALLTACIGIVLGRHTETDPLFALAVPHGRSTVLLDHDSTHFVPQKVLLTDQSVLSAIQTVDREHKTSPKTAALSLSDLSDFASHHSAEFDVLLSFRSSPPRVTSASADVHSRGTVDFEVHRDGQQFILKVSGPLNEKRAEYVLSQVSAVIQATLSSPSASIKSMSLVRDAELATIYDLAQCENPEPALVHAAFESWAEKSPEKQAIELEGGVAITYGELNARANRLAHYLIEKGVTPGSMVPLYLDKSGDMIMSILAVLKCGAAYVPLSPDNPAKRNIFVMSEIKAQILISQTEYKEFETEHSTTTVYVDDMPDLGSYSAKNTNIGDINSVAYCLFTSGSTGTPKGVAVSHRAISVAIRGHLDCEQTTPETRHLIFANYTFDVSVHDIFSILGSGATLCVVSTQRLMSDLTGIMNEMKVTQTFLTPTVARLFTPSQVPTMKTLLCGGEALTTDIIDVWAKDCTLINMYGPTELAVDVTYNWVDHKTKSTALGHPMNTCSIMIVDRDTRRLSPLGGLGEICVAGGHLADGYLNRDDLTDKAFVPCPVPGFDRMYRTGDLGRWLPDNTLQYLGRIDNQIKLNGHRIELGEIEQVVINSGLSPSCVAMILDKWTRPQLAVFGIFQPSGETAIQSPASKELLTKLGSHFSSLAHYMVPSFVFPVGNIPRMTASNKSDRKSLKLLAEQLGFEELTSYSLEAVAAEEQGDSAGETLSEIETSLRDMWAEMFVRPKASINTSTNFAALGGDSISAINLVSACRKLGYSLSVNDILKEKTLRSIAQRMKRSDAAKALKAKTYEPPSAIDDLLDQHGLESNDVEYIYPCAPGQSEFLSHGSSKDQNWTVTAVRPLPHDANAYLEMLQQLTKVNDILRTTFAKIEGHGWVGVVLRDPIVDFTTLSCDPADKDRIVEGVRKKKFGFGRPFVRYVLLRYPDGSQDLAMKMDHGLWDGTSLRIFDDMVLALQREGKAPAVTPFRDFALDQWQNDKSESLGFWRDVVKSGQGSETQAASPKTDSVHTLHTDESVDANGLAEQCGITPATLFQGVFQMWLAERSGGGHASYDYLLTGRNVDLPNPQSINGVCANFLPFRLPVAGDQTLPDFLSDTQDFFWQATKYGNVNLDDIYSDAGLDRQAVANRVLFLYQPFEPSDTSKTEMRWVVLAMAKSWMTQPYALMQEVHKVGSGYKIVVKYDSKVYSAETIEGFTKRQVEILKSCITKGGKSVQLKQVIHC